jgi:hypothetical protein
MQGEDGRPSLDRRLDAAIRLIEAGKRDEARDVLVAVLKAIPPMTKPGYGWLLP